MCDKKYEVKKIADGDTVKIEINEIRNGVVENTIEVSYTDTTDTTLSDLVKELSITAQTPKAQARWQKLKRELEEAGYDVSWDD